MVVNKEEKVYTITESRTKWTATREYGKVTLNIDIPKENCKTEDDLKEFIISNEMF